MQTETQRKESILTNEIERLATIAQFNHFLEASAKTGVIVSIHALPGSGTYKNSIGEEVPVPENHISFGYGQGSTATQIAGFLNTTSRLEKEAAASSAGTV